LRRSPAVSPYRAPYRLYDTNIPQVMALDWIRPHSRVLEVGCASGRVSKLLVNNLDCSVVGIEIDPDLATEARYSCEKVVVGDIENEEIWASVCGDYDYVLFFDVLEHLKDPWKALRATRQHCFGGLDTKLIGAIPNTLVWHTRVEFLLGNFEYRSGGTLDRGHLRFFTPPSTRDMLQLAGFDVLQFEVSWHMPILSWLYSKWMCLGHPLAAQRLREKVGWASPAFPLLRTLSPADDPRLVKLVNRVLGLPAQALPGLFGNHSIFLCGATAGEMQ